MDLNAQLAWLKAKLLVDVTTPFPDPFTDEEKASIASYLLLAHACIEEELEELFAERVNEILKLIRAGGSIPLCVANFAFNSALAQPADKRTSYKTRKLHGVCIAAFQTYKLSVLQQNHGIKRENLLAMAEGAGVEWEEFELAHSSAIADLSTLGAKRGGVGHLSPFSGKSTLITTRVDVPDIIKWVEDAEHAVADVRSYLMREFPQVTP